MLRRSFLAGVVTLALAGCAKESPPRALLYRLTITVDTPEGQKVGSSVARLWIGFGDGPLGGMGAAIFFNLKGAATVVDLGPRGYLLCLLWRDELRRGSTGQEGLLVPFAARPYRDRNMKMPQAIDAVVEARPKVSIPLKSLPALVRFRDPSQPSTAEWIDPANLDAVFGPGVAIARVDYEILGKPPMKPGAKLTDEIEVPEITASVARLQAVIPWIRLPKEKIAEMVKGSDLDPYSKNFYPGRGVIARYYISGVGDEH